MTGTEEAGKRKKYGYGRRCGRKGSWGRGGARSVYAGCLLSAALLLGGFSLPAEASPASLTSGSAVVYEQMSETSAPLENLIQDGSFEYLGDVTAADGSVWHAVETPGGVSGYIRGDIGIRQQEVLQETPGDTQSEETGNRDQAGNEENVGQTAGLGEQETAGAEGAVETEEPGGEAARIGSIENNRTKTYAADALGERIKNRRGKETENVVAVREAQDGERKAVWMDRTFLLCILVAVFSGAAALAFLKKLGKERGWRNKSAFPEKERKKYALRDERKRGKSRRRRKKKHGKKHPESKRESGGQRGQQRGNTF